MHDKNHIILIKKPGTKNNTTKRNTQKNGIFKNKK